MKTKTAKLLVILFVITICLSFGTVALADESISTSVRVNPPSLPGSGTVSVVVTIKNDGDPISNVKLKYPSPTDTEVNIGDIGTGETKEHVNESWNITEEMFGKDLAFTVTWTSMDGSVKSGQTPAIVIEQKAETVDVVGEASADPTEIKAGDRVKFKFSMQNKGNVPVDNAYLNAPPIEGGNQIGSNFSLEPGATKNMEYTITVNESMTVNPVFTYAVNGTQQTLTLNAVSVNVDQPANVTMNMTLQANQTTTAQGGDVNFTVTVSNTGNSQLDGLQVKDFNGNPVSMSSTSLQPGAQATGTVTLPISQTGNYSFTGSAVGAGGQTLNIQSNNVAITLEGDQTPAPEASDSDTLDASKIIRTDISLSSTQLSKPGEVNMVVNVTNLTEEPLTNIVVMDAIIGTIGTAGSLAAGETTTFEKSFTAEETAAYEFITTAQLPDGTAVESAVGTTITVDQNGGDLESWQLGLIIVGAAIAAIAVVLVLYARRIKNNRNGQRQSQGRRPNPQDPHAEPRYSASGRERPQRYTNGRYEPDYDRRPERPTSAQQQEYQRKRGSRVETIDPNKARASYAEQKRKEPASKNALSSNRHPRGNQSSSPKFGDRNKF